VYCADSRALAALEILVHAQGLGSSPELVFFEVDFPQEVRIHAPRTLPDGWNGEPVESPSQAVGAKWISEAAAAVLKVPSAVIPKEFNLILNPAHPDFKKARVRGPEKFALDPRLFSARF
jgi:RES domain-containing protein